MITSIPKIFKNMLDVCKEYGPGVIGYIVVLLLVVVLFVEQERRTTNILQQQQQTIQTVIQYTIKEHEQTKSEIHKRRYKERIKVAPQINNILASYIDRINTDHIFIGEYHNGEENIATGIPFCKFSMTAEYFTPGHESFINRYTNENITKYNILPYLLNNHMVKYSVEELRSLDYYLYLQLYSFGVKSIVLCSMSDDENFPMGLIGCVLYEDRDINTFELISCKDEIKKILININKNIK